MDGLRRSLRAAVAVSAAGLIPLHAAGPAAAAPSEQVIRGQYLTLTSIADRAAMASLAPGVPAWWEVGVAAAAPDAGAVRLSMAIAGPLATPGRAVRIGVASCSVRWVGTGCPDDRAQPLEPVAAQTVADGAVQLGTMPADQQRWLRVAVELPVDRVTAPGESLTIRIIADGSSESLAVDSPGGQITLPDTGVAVRGAAALAAVLLGAGWLLLVLGRRRRAREQP